MTSSADLVRRLSRRAFLGRVGASALALPFARLLSSPARAQATQAPKRFIVFFSPNGTIPEEFAPDGGETDFQPRRILQPLEPYRQRLLVLEGLDMTMGGPGDGHQQGMGWMLTGRKLLPGDTVGGCDSCAGVSWASGISVDQYIANHIGDDTRFRSLELGAKTGGGANVWTRMSYRGSAEPLPPEDDPYRAFERVFGDMDSHEGSAQERRMAIRKSVLDFAQEDFATVRGKLGHEDRQLLDSHLEAVRDIERRLEAPNQVGAACEAPVMGEKLDKDRDENFPEILKLQMDIGAMAIACDLTRVVSMQWTKSVGNITMPWLNIGSSRHHDLSHEGDGNADAKEKLIQINRWYAEQLGYLIGKLSSIPEGDGSVMDNTVILWCNELGKGNSHTRNNVPFVIAGDAGGYFRTGRYLSFQERPHTDMHVSLANAFGIDTDTFGDPDITRGPLSELT